MLVRVRAPWARVAECGHCACRADLPVTRWPRAFLCLQMVWERGCVVIVMLTPLSENGVRQCYHYWPDEGSNLYHVYEVNLVSEHIWCEDFLVRSFYLKNLQTNETRTVTQFHFLSWYDQGVPSSARSLLDFRRKILTRQKRGKFKMEAWIVHWIR
uniref:receptor-type tyrosine-protein phosphatase N2-like isoform X2 n=1 Tax=Halichoerus grypus TaxID=9711 RepID=UPI0016596D04|nr:receptor-type tyrosine-protein phosphatase N2-like isoform X2 [Halichoerus grypus]